jgi:hypothetical protein
MTSSTLLQLHLAKASVDDKVRRGRRRRAF